MLSCWRMLTRALLALGCGLVAAASSWAQEADNLVLQRLDRLEQENRELRQAYESLANASRIEPEPAPTPANVPADGNCVPADGNCVPADGNCLPADSTAECDDWCQLFFDERVGPPGAKITGFVQFDSGWVSQDAANRAAVGDISDTTGIRRLRLRAHGNVLPDVSYLVDLDFAASGHPSFRDVKFTVHEQPLLQNVQIGYFIQPFGFDASTSGRELLLLERQLPFAFAPFRQSGVGAYGTTADEMLQWSLSGYRYPTNTFGVSQGESGGWGYANRVTMLPYVNEEHCCLVHVGGSYSYANPGDGTVDFSIEPGFFVTDPMNKAADNSVPVFVNTGDIPASGLNLAGLEAAIQIRSFNIQGEMVGAFVDQIGGPNLAFSAASAKIAYVLTGESHPYDRQQGIFRRVIPNEDAQFLSLQGGAWEAVAAWSYIDLDDQNIQGGQLQTITFGLNRYLNDYVKVQLNVIRALLDDPVDGNGAATFVALRAQAEF
ncbi:porin [Anatilimnocola sp. NA78]|uniref:OprO/OprP family phosphate-selective porin n=1 Tax=Anatilimnocola sp. NA78 TaxID=3415683 RepID=UPI003CE47048